ncbi:MAG: helix-turn-helix domain-containing protein, partial [Deinococcales bacterium]
METRRAEDATGFDVGARIRALREERGLSIRALADRCTLSVNAISLIERGKTSPTVASLHLLAGALGVPIVDFFHDLGARGVVYVGHDRRLRHDADGKRMESLGTGLNRQQLEPFLFTLEPGAGGGPPARHPGQEFAHCLEGRVEYEVDGAAYPLEPGDSLQLEA